MDWYSAAVVFEVSVPDEVLDHSISLLMVQADDESSARREALRHGKAAEVDYKNSDREPVAWRCTEVLFVHKLIDTELTAGTEVYDCFVSRDLLDEIRSRLVG